MFLDGSAIYMYTCNIVIRYDWCVCYYFDVIALFGCCVLIFGLDCLLWLVAGCWFVGFGVIMAWFHGN